MTDYKSMFEQAVRTLAAIDEALGIGDDGCGDPDQTLTAIAELKAGKVGAGRTALRHFRAPRRATAFRVGGSGAVVREPA